MECAQIVSGTLIGPAVSVAFAFVAETGVGGGGQIDREAPGGDEGEPEEQRCGGSGPFCRSTFKPQRKLFLPECAGIQQLHSSWLG